MTEAEVDLPAWSLRRQDAGSRPLPRAWPHRIDREWAWGGSDGAGAQVAIVDSGIDISHPDLALTTSPTGWDCTSGAGVTPSDNANHGTGVASIAGARWDSFVGALPLFSRVSSAQKL